MVSCITLDGTGVGTGTGPIASVGENFTSVEEVSWPLCTFGAMKIVHVMKIPV